MAMSCLMIIFAAVSVDLNIANTFVSECKIDARHSDNGC